MSEKISPSNARTPRNSKDFILGLDIGTYSVKAMIAQRKKQKIEVIGRAEVAHLPNNIKNGAISDLAGVMAVCEKAIYATEQQAGITAHHTVINIGSELVKSLTSTVSYTRNNSKKAITEQELEAIIDKVKEHNENKTKKEIALELGLEKVEIRLISSAIVALEIDGQSVVNPVGYKGSKLSVQIYTAFAPLVLVSALEKLCLELNLDLLAVAPDSFAIARAEIGENQGVNFTKILIDVGGENTTFALVYDGGIEAGGVFGIGGEHFTRELAQKMKLDYKTAEEIKRELKNEVIAEAENKEIEESFDDSLETWMTALVMSLAEIGSEVNLPNEIVLSGGGANLEKIKKALDNLDQYEELNFSEKPKVTMVEMEKLPDVKFLLSEPVSITDLVAVGLIRIGVDTLLSNPGPSIFDRILSK